MMKDKLVFIFLCLAYFISETCHAQKKLFELLPSSQTNITFNNKVEDTKEHNILIYSNYYGGAGVGVGDFNNDGFQDIFFAGNLVADQLYINKGKFQFEEITSNAGIVDNGGWSSGVIVGDVNNDGWQDIYVTRELYDDRPELRKNKLYINNGDLTFSESGEAYKVDHDGRTRHAVFLDYNKDGWLDLFLLTQPPNPGNYSPMFGSDLELNEYAPVLLRNTGNGDFENVSKGSGLDIPCFPNSASASDFNNDGWVDLYVANDFHAPDMLYINNGDGTFQNTLNKSTGHIAYFSMGVDAADFNNDGLLDISVVDMSAEKNQRIKANMSGMNPRTFWDLVEKGGHYQYMYNTLQLNQGSIDSSGLSFSDIAQMAGVSSTDWSWSNLMADFDNDGKKDMYVTNGILRDIRNTDSDKNFSKYIAKLAENFVRNNPNAGDVSLWDIIDLEEALDIIPSEELSNYAYKNETGLSFANTTREWGLEYKSFSNGSAFVDLDNDGALDLVVNNVNRDAFVFKNNSRELNQHNYFRVSLKSRNSFFGSKVKISTGNEEQWYEFTSARGMYSCSEQVAHFGIGNFDKIDTLKVFWPDGKVSVYEGLEANQHLVVDDGNDRRAPQLPSPDFVAAFRKVSAEAIGLSFKHAENDFDDYSKQILLPHKMSHHGPALAVSDINGDGRDDVFIGGAAGQASVLYLQNPKGAFELSQPDFWERDALYEDIDALFFDFDSDGDKDLYVVSGGNAYPNESKAYQDRLYRNDGNGRFEKFNQSLPQFYESGSCVRATDFDKDGDLDLFIGGRHVPWKYPEPTSSRILQNENGAFKDITSKSARDLIDIGMVTDAVWTDFDQDGLPDLMVVGEWMPITYIRNNGESFYNATNEFGLASHTGWWYSIEQADLDNDGDTDYLLGNLGLNYKYKATNEEPFEVYFKDFDGNGQKDIVLSYYNFGKKYPLRGRSCSSQQIPVIGQKFKTYDLFASADLYNVYGAKELNSALNYKARSFAHIKIENLRQGRFQTEQLPEYSQMSSLNDFIVHDFNGDEQSDVLAVGNNFQVEVETPRNDAGKGVFLINNEKGFHSVPPLRSGFFAQNDARKVSLITVGSQLKILVANNNGQLELFDVIADGNTLN